MLNVLLKNSMDGKWNRLFFRNTIFSLCNLERFVDVEYVSNMLDQQETRKVHHSVEVIYVNDHPGIGKWKLSQTNFIIWSKMRREGKKTNLFAFSFFC